VDPVADCVRRAVPTTVEVEVVTAERFEMPFITTVAEEATRETAKIYELYRARAGYVPNYAKLFSLRPTVYEAWGKLNGAIKNSMDLRRYELVTVAAARKLKSSYCSLAHGRCWPRSFSGPARSAPLSATPSRPAWIRVDVAVMDLAAKVASDATSVTEADVHRLKDLGLSDAEVLDVVLAAAARCFFSKALDALGVQADAAYADLEPERRRRGPCRAAKGAPRTRRVELM